MRVEKRHKGRVPHEQPRGMIRETKRLKKNKGGELDEGAGLWWSAEECVCAAVAEGIMAHSTRKSTRSRQRCVPFGVRVCVERKK